MLYSCSNIYLTQTRTKESKRRKQFTKIANSLTWIISFKNKSIMPIKQ